MEPRCTCDAAEQQEARTTGDNSIVTNVVDEEDAGMASRMPSSGFSQFAVSTAWLDALEVLDNVVAGVIESETGTKTDVTPPQMPATTYALVVAPTAVAEPSVLRRMLSTRPQEQLDELHFLSQVFTESDTRLKVDRFGRLLFRATITLDIAGGAIHALLTVTVPPAYPAIGHPLEVRVTSRKGAKSFLAAITKELQDAALQKAGTIREELLIAATNTTTLSADTELLTAMSQADPSSALTEMLNCAKQLLSEMPIAKMAEHYCTCVECNTRLLKEKLDKYPQPAMRADNGECVCLTCGSVALPLPNVRPAATGANAATPITTSSPTTMEEQPPPLCSFCYVDDDPLVFLECGCISCLECFNRFSDIAIGARALRKLPLGRGKIVIQKHDKSPSPTQLLRELVGIPCPNHQNDPKAIIYDPALLKLLPPRTYNRFNFFAMEFAFDKQPGVVYCPLPKCCGYVFITDQPGELIECPFCGEIFCTRCQNAADGDACTCTKYANITRLSALNLAERYGVPALYDHRYKERQVEKSNSSSSSGTTPLSALSSSSSSVPSVVNSFAKQPSMHEPDGGWVFVLVTLRSKQLPLRLPLRGVWYPILAHFVLSSQLCPYGQQFRAREEVFLAMFHGALLDPALSLGSQLLFTGAVLFVIETFHAEDYTLRKVNDSAHRLYYASKQNVSQLIAKKKCPVCTKPVIHYLNHGCHMIFGCHPGMPEWCYVCGSIANGHKCPKGCPLFCKFKAEKDFHGRLQITAVGCDCTLCPDCKPMRPCDNCTLCPMCTMDGLTSLI